MELVRSIRFTLNICPASAGFLFIVASQVIV